MVANTTETTATPSSSAGPHRVPGKSTLFVRNLSKDVTQEQLEEYASRIGPVKWCFLVTEKGDQKKSRGFGFVQYALKEDADRAVIEFRKELFHDRRLIVDFAKAKEDTGRKDKPKKSETTEPKSETETETTSATETPATPSTQTRKQRAGRLIIRNLSFNVNEDFLRKIFRPYGGASEVTIPRTVNPKTGKKSSRGFAFVQLPDKQSAKKAMLEVNGRELLGRKVAVDMSIPKDKFEATKAAENPKEEEEEEQEEEDGDDDDNEGEDDGEEEDEQADLEDEGEDDTEEAEDEDDEDDDEGNDNDDDDDDDDNEDDDEDDEDEDEDGSESNKKKKKDLESDVDQGKTLFIRNLAFSAEEDELQELFESFGRVLYCLIVTDKATGKSRGMAFVKFAKKEAVEKCLEKAGVYTMNPDEAKTSSSKPAFQSVLEDDSLQEGIVFHGRRLNVTRAVEKKQSEQLNEQREKKLTQKLDKRNLYLAREGFIKPAIAEALGLSKGDIAKRAKAEQEKKVKLRNPNFFVSRTRLSVRNLPLTVTDKDLKKLFLEACKDRVNRIKASITQQPDEHADEKFDEVEKEGVHQRIVIKQSKIVRSADRNSSGGVLRSKGYGFIEFTEHSHAIAALREVNNNPKYFGPARRPIVEFSLENVLSLKTRADRQKRFEQKEGKSEVNDKKRPHKEPHTHEAPKKQRQEKTQPVLPPTTKPAPSKPAAVKPTAKPIKLETVPLPSKKAAPLQLKKTSNTVPNNNKATKRNRERDEEEGLQSLVDNYKKKLFNFVL